MTFDNSNNFPFNACDTTELSSINTNDRYFSIDNHELQSSQMNTENDLRSTYLDDIDKEKGFEINLKNLSSCEYYSCDEFQKLNTNNNFNIYHNNVNGLETKFKFIHNFVSNTISDIDVIAITETSQHISNENFKAKIEIDGYKCQTKVELQFILKPILILLKELILILFMIILNQFGLR